MEETYMDISKRKDPTWKGFVLQDVAVRTILEKQND